MCGITYVCLPWQALEEEEGMTPEQLVLKNVGKQVGVLVAV